jgi:hypothetical protein
MASSPLGIVVGPNFPRSPLFAVSPSALRVWCLLASRAAHSSRDHVVSGHTVKLETGDVPVSWRILQRDLGMGSTSVSRCLGELRTAELIETTPVFIASRQRSQTSSVNTPESVAPQRYGNGSARRCLLTVVKLRHFKALAANHNAPQTGASTYRAHNRSPFSARDLQERREMEAALALEGRC